MLALILIAVVNEVKLWRLDSVLVTAPNFDGLGIWGCVVAARSQLKLIWLCTMESSDIKFCNHLSKFVKIDFIDTEMYHQMFWYQVCMRLLPLIVICIFLISPFCIIIIIGEYPQKEAHGLQLFFSSEDHIIIWYA